MVMTNLRVSFKYNEKMREDFLNCNSWENRISRIEALIEKL